MTAYNLSWTGESLPSIKKKINYFSAFSIFFLSIIFLFLFVSEIKTGKLNIQVLLFLCFGVTYLILIFFKNKKSKSNVANYALRTNENSLIYKVNGAPWFIPYSQINKIYQTNDFLKIDINMGEKKPKKATTIEIPLQTLSNASPSGFIENLVKLRNNTNKTKPYSPVKKFFIFSFFISFVFFLMLWFGVLITGSEFEDIGNKATLSAWKTKVAIATLYFEASIFNNVSAQEGLAVAYYSGVMLPENEPKSRYWSDKAVKNGSTRAKKILTKINKTDWT